MRVNYVKYIADTGEIRQWGDCAEDSPIFDPEYAEGNLRILKGSGKHATHYVRLSDLTILEKPEQPSQYHVFNYTTSTWAMSGVKAWEDIRSKRDKLLAACDWTVMPDVPLSDARREAWMAYRQALRDMTAQSNPLELAWPIPPN